MTQRIQSPWGPADQRGATNYVTPEVTLEAVRSVQTGRILELSHEIQAGHPRLEPFISPLQISMWAVPDTIRPLLKEHFQATNDVGVFTERVELCMHTSTHIDALGHFTIGDEMFNGYHYQTSSTNWGLKQLGIEQVPPLITRGVVLDVAATKGVEHLDGGEVVTVELLQKALNAARVTLQPGDVVLIRTGWGKYFMTDNVKYTESEPGIDLDAARFLTEQKVCAIGADTMAVEVMPNPDPHLVLPVHQHALVEKGVHLIENVNFEEVLEAGVNTFCFILLALKLVGATGSPVRVIGVV